MKDQVIVITGASAGIGATLAELVGSRGARPVLLARRERELQEVAARCGPDALAIVADVTRREDLQRAVEAALAASVRLTSGSTTPGAASRGRSPSSPTPTSTR